MVNAQEWLDKKCPENDVCQERKTLWGSDNENFGKKRSEIEELDISYEKLTRSLVLEGFDNLKSFTSYQEDHELAILDISRAKRLASFTYVSSQKEKGISKLIVGNLPNLTELMVRNNQLTELDLSSCCSLKIIFCSDNQIQTLNLLNCQELEDLRCENNKITKLEDLELNQKRNLKFLQLDFNRITAKLDSFKNLIQLETLSIAGNQIYGSLESLKNLTNLRYLDISETNIDRGLEYLSESLTSICCSSIDAVMKDFNKQHNSNFWCNLDYYSVGIKKIEEVLEPFIESVNDRVICHFPSWRIRNIDKVKQARIEVLEKEVNELKRKVSLYEIFFSEQKNKIKSELNPLLENLNNEEKEWLQIYCECRQELVQNSFVSKQLKRAEQKLLKSFTEEELELVFHKKKEICKLESQLNNLEITEQLQIETPTSSSVFNLNV